MPGFTEFVPSIYLFLLYFYERLFLICWRVCLCWSWEIDGFLPPGPKEMTRDMQNLRGIPRGTFPTTLSQAHSGPNTHTS